MDMAISRPEGLHIPPILLKHIRRAEQRKDPFSKLFDEQFLITGFVAEQLSEINKRAQEEGEPTRDFSGVTHLAGVAYHAMHLAYRQPLITVEENVLDEYLTSVRKQPDPLRPRPRLQLHRFAVQCKLPVLFAAFVDPSFTNLGFEDDGYGVRPLHCIQSEKWNSLVPLH